MIFTVSIMGLDERIDESHENRADQSRAISLHAYSDLSHVSPLVFLYLLRECYVYGTSKATKKFRALQQQVHQVLYNSPQPGPAVFVARCLFVLPILESYSEGFAHLIISALRHIQKVGTTLEDLDEAMSLAAQLILFIIDGSIDYDEKVLTKMLEVFNISLIDIEDAMCNAKLNSSGLEAARTFLEKYIHKKIDSKAYMAAVTLLEHFSICDMGESFLIEMMQNQDYRAADKWAAFMGKPMLCVLVKEYSERNLLKNAYEIIKRNNLRHEFPEVYMKCKESSLKKLAEKGCWDIAEAKTNDDKQLLEYLVYLAMEAGYFEKVDELCDRYSLKGFVTVKEPETNHSQRRYLQLSDFVLEDIIWVDEVKCLLNATCYLEECKVVGLDCEWKPNYEKGSKPNKVSIMQIASEKMVFILDLIKLFQDVPDILDNCLVRILHSPRILKLGYNIQCDMNQLAHSYGRLGCFKHYEMLLDIQNIFEEARGGLSGLAEKILGAGLNKTRRNTNWEKRPLTQNQLEYAALDAVVLIHLFGHIRSHYRTAGSSEEHAHIEWNSHIVPHMNILKKIRKGKKKITWNAETDVQAELLHF